MNKYNFIGLTLLFLMGVGFFGFKVLDNMRDYKQIKIDHAKHLDLKETLFDFKDYLFGSEKKEMERDAKMRLKKADESKTRATHAAIFVFIISIIYFGVVFLFYRSKILTLKHVAISIITVSAAFLALGVFTPMMEMSAYLDGVEVPIKGNWSKVGGEVSSFIGDLLPDSEFDFSQKFDGQVYAFYQCKSIADLIGILYESGNFFVGTAILFFSVLFPCLKLIFSFLFVLSNSLRKKKIFMNTVSYIGKFSMADVQVVAVFLAYLAFNNLSQAVTTEGKVILGLYLFTGYCVLSILVFFVIKKLSGVYFVERKVGYEQTAVLDPNQPLLE